MREKKKMLLYKKHTYILKVLLSVVAARIEAFVILGISFCTPVSKKSAACELSHVLTPSINSSLLLKHCDQPVLQVGKVVVVAQS
jgi:hypothetical protein